MAITPHRDADWKKILQDVKNNSTSGRVLLEEGTRKTLHNRDEEPLDRGRLLGMMEERLCRRKINRKAPKSINITPYEKRLKGLFGSDD